MKYKSKFDEVFDRNRDGELDFWESKSRDLYLINAVKRLEKQKEDSSNKKINYHRNQRRPQAAVPLWKSMLTIGLCVGAMIYMVAGGNKGVGLLLLFGAIVMGCFLMK